MGTMRDALLAFAQGHGASADGFEEYLSVWASSRISTTLPERYKRLSLELALALPEDWDRHATWFIEEGGIGSQPVYGSAHREEEGEGDYQQFWIVGLYTARMDRLSDSACRWVIAHELAHVASGIPTGSIVIGGKACTRIRGTADQYQEAPTEAVHEDAADQIAIEWGFSNELQAFLAEDR